MESAIHLPTQFPQLIQIQAGKVESGKKAWGRKIDQLHATAFQHSPLGRPILGPVDNIKNITKADIQKYISEHYAPHRMVLSTCLLIFK